MELFRISKRQYAGALSGVGASLYGGRWNHKGTEVVYTAGNRALAMVEVLVHVSLDLIPEDLVLLTIHVPDELPIKCLTAKELPRNWNRYPHPPQSMELGDRFVREAEFPLLRVPSSLVKGDFNYLLNPAHSAFSRIQILEREPFPLEKRLFVPR